MLGQRVFNKLYISIKIKQRQRRKSKDKPISGWNTLGMAQTFAMMFVCDVLIKRHTPNIRLPHIINECT